MRTGSATFIFLFLAACTRSISQGPIPTLAVDPTPAFSPTSTQTSTETLVPIPTSTVISSLAPTQAQIPTETTTPALPPLITLVFTGQIIPARCVQAAIDAKDNADTIYEGVLDLLQPADLTLGTLNASLSDAAPQTGCVETSVFAGSPENADTLARAGFDVMSVATDHIKDCGKTDCGAQAFVETLENLRRVGILPVGAGNNQGEAMQPVFVEIKGVRFGIVSLGQIEQNAFAGENSPGIGVLNEENLRAAIAIAREMADVVIVMPHGGPEYTHAPDPSQLELAQVAVDAGADLIVGSHPHVIQAFGEVNGVPIFYGLGNFVFDDTQERERQQSLILRVYFQGAEYLGFEIFPAITEKDGTIHLADQEETEEILLKLQEINEDLR